MKFDAIVFGSKPNSKIPKDKVKKIYTANGAAIRALNYKKKIQKAKLFAIVARKEFYKKEIQNNIYKSKPNLIICRSGKIKVSNFNLKYFTNLNQIIFQSKFFKYGIFSIFLSELKYETNFFKKINHLYQCLFKQKFQGASTGLFSILFALNDKNNKSILISGVGLEGGNTMYKYVLTENKKNYYKNRSNVDKYLIKHLQEKFIKKLYSLDIEMSKNSKIAFYNSKN